MIKVCKIKQIASSRLNSYRVPYHLYYQDNSASARIIILIYSDTSQYIYIYYGNFFTCPRGKFHLVVKSDPVSILRAIVTSSRRLLLYFVLL